ncbi:PAS domain S-box protein [Duganella sp. BJB488]|uniref:PAS domain-containing sensor histidine kinase n=2 Tax=Duganella TaxID=75654 RepID=UPI000E3515E6|nr:PAS domain-containing protein [Duganella sp. BJB488]NVD70949.1 PAS domain-containing protein [Duganella sp. BJB1802]RFP15177.1 PAS domain S-box protein [Duganella sp. BJB489]RFP19732.1 PAS domain S-box protein [Duganella sp. BJB488]RFP38120.1 PAS domain S-box protein [Duganella sp. BJB480]
MKNLIESLGKSDIESMLSRVQGDGAGAAADGDLHQLVSAMPLALFIKDAQSNVLLMNPACEALWGIPFDAMCGNDGAAFFPAEQTAYFLEHDRIAFDSGKHVVYEEELWHAGLGENRWLQTHKQPIYDAQGRPKMLIAMCVDITDRKRAESKLKSSLHELRTLSQHQHTAKESERRRIAQDVHDDLAQNLLALKLDVTALHNRTRARQPLLHRRTALALSTLDASILAVRELINELHPRTLELGLSAAIEWQMQQLERRHGLRCRLELLEDSAALDQRQITGIYGIVLTALGYLCEQSGTRSVQATLNLRPQQLSIVVSGDGLSEPQSARGALDLGAIRARLADFGGELAVAHLPGAGTVLRMNLPATIPVP